MKETPHSWLAQADPYESSKNYMRKYRRRVMGFKVRICPECSRVHEKVWDGNSSHMIYYDDFPKYKLTKKNCGDCNG